MIHKFSLDDAALVVARTLVVFYASGMALQLWFWVFAKTARVSRPIIVYAAGWHTVLCGLSMQVLLSNQLPGHVYWRASYNAAFLGALTGLAWIIFEGRNNWRAEQRVEIVDDEELKAAVTQIMAANKDVENED